MYANLEFMPFPFDFSSKHYAGLRAIPLEPKSVWVKALLISKSSILRASPSILALSMNPLRADLNHTI